IVADDEGTSRRTSVIAAQARGRNEKVDGDWESRRDEFSIKAGQGQTCAFVALTTVFPATSCRYPGRKSQAPDSSDSPLQPDSSAFSYRRPELSQTSGPF